MLNAKPWLRTVFATCLPLFASCFFLSHQVLAQLDISEHETENGHLFWLHEPLIQERETIQFQFTPVLTDHDLRLPFLSFLAGDVLMQGGTQTLSSDDLAEALADIDADLTFAGTFDNFEISLQAPTEHLLTAVQYLNDLLKTPRLDPITIKRQKRFQLRHDTQTRRSTQGALDDLVNHIVFNKHPHRSLIRIESQDSLKDISQEDIGKWQKRSLTSSNVTISAISYLDSEFLSKAIDTAMADLPRQPIMGEAKRVNSPQPNDLPLKPWPPSHFPKRPVLLHLPDAKRTLLAAHLPLPLRSYALDREVELVIDILGSGVSSRLFKSMREDLRAAYDFAAMRDAYSLELELLRLYGEVDPALVPQAIDKLKQTFKELKQDGVGEAELERAKSYSAQKLDYVLSNDLTFASFLSEKQRLGLRRQDVNTIFWRYAALARRDLNGFIRVSLGSADEMLIVLVSPNPNILPGACTITNYQDWEACL